MPDVKIALKDYHELLRIAGLLSGLTKAEDMKDFNKEGLFQVLRYARSGLDGVIERAVIMEGEK